MIDPFTKKQSETLYHTINTAIEKQMGERFVFTTIIYTENGIRIITDMPPNVLQESLSKVLLDNSTSTGNPH